MVTEVFSRIGEEEICSENPNFHRRNMEEDDDFEEIKQIECSSKPLTEAKKEFFKKMEEDPLTLDTCDNLNRDWKKK